MDFEIDFAREPKVIPPDIEVAPSPETQEAYIEAAKNLYGDAAPSIGRVLTEKGSGSAFFVEDDAIVTDAHVVQDAKFHRLETTDGKRYTARLEKLDDINDLAYLRLVGVEDGKYKPLTLNNQSPSSADAFALGHPYGRLNVYISPGRIESKGTQLDYNCSTRSQKYLERYRTHINEQQKMLELMAGILGKETTTKPIPPCREEWTAKIGDLPTEQQSDGQKWLDRPSLQGLIEIHPGNSGGPLVDRKGEVIGVSRMIEGSDPASSNYTPVEVLNDFLKEPEQKFNFDYGYHNSSLIANVVYQSPGVSTAVLGTGAGLSTLAAKKIPRITAVGAIVLGYENISDDIRERQFLTDPRARFQNAVEIGSDTATIGGGIAALARKNRRIGFAVAATGLVSRFASEFIPTELKLNSIERQDGTARAPFDPKLLGVK